MLTRYAQKIGTYNRKPVYRIPVVIVFNDSSLCETIGKLEFNVISHSAVDAANWAREQYAERAETEIYAYGPKGGETYRYIGWDSAIGHSLFNRAPESGKLF